MRQIILDTETTGLEPTQGHRIIEIGCVELVNRKKTEKSFHQYLNPQREVEDGAYDVHGLSQEFLADKPVFRDIIQDFIDFVRDSELIIHNAPFDVAFINNELALIGTKWGQLEDYCQILDTLKIAREKHPGQKNSLDALCSRYSVDNSQRDMHGALLDAQILLDVYLAMTGGQTTLSLDDEVITATNGTKSTRRFDQARPQLKLIQPDQDELAAHQRMLDFIDEESNGKCIWKTLDTNN